MFILNMSNKRFSVRKTIITGVADLKKLQNINSQYSMLRQSILKKKYEQNQFLGFLMICKLQNDFDERHVYVMH